MLLAQVAAPETMEAAASRTGFKNMSESFVDKFAKSLGVDWKALPPRERPTGVLSKVEALIRKLRTGISDQDLAQAIKIRGGLHGPQRVSPVVEGSNIECCDGCLDPMDAKDTKKWAKEQVAEHTTKKATTLQWLWNRKCIQETESKKMAISIGVERPPLPPAKRPQPKKKVMSYDEKTLKACCPPPKGATIQEVIRDNYIGWCARYPDVKPASRTRAYGRGIASEDVARHCMSWLWMNYLAEHPSESCPWDFDVLVA